ncbi:MAG TPA: PilW family protein [Casimicrobiaceae bacterium]|nr:PilW family protein [Casimicrobiaceae bacterium]
MSARPQRGMGLVELMVWMVISLLVIIVIGIIYVNSKQLTRVNDTVSRMQENGRFAMYLIERDLRMAAFRGCNGAAVTPANLLNSAAYPYQYANGVAGYAGSSEGTWSPALDSSISALAPAPLSGSDVITVRLVDGPGIPLVAKQASSTADLSVEAGSSIGAGDVLLVADCSNSAIFNATSFDSGAGTIGHAAGDAVAPGNTSADLGHVYSSDASVYRMTTRTYYIAPSSRRPGINSLWSNSVPAYDGQAQPEEIVEGVEGLALLFGEDLDGQRAANRYVTADAVGNWANVVSLRAQVLLGTTRDNVATKPQQYSFDGSSTTPTDRRIRTTMASVVTVRNRVP